MTRSLRFIIALALLALFVLPACGQLGQPNKSPQDGITIGGPSGTKLEFARLEEFDGSLRAFVEANEKKQGIRFLTIGDKTYIMYAWGEKPTGGYGVRIASVEDTDEAVIVKVELSAPKPGDVVTQALTYPFDVVETGRLDKEIHLYTGGAETIELKTTSRIVVTSPAVNAEVSGGKITVKGWARVWEGALMVELEDGHNILGRKAIQASEGAPGRGEFEAELTYTRPSGSHGMLIFYTESAEDGSRQDVVMVPVTFK